MCSSLFQNFCTLSLLIWSNIYIYIYFYFLFSALIFQGFLSSCPSKSLLTLLFQLIHIFHAFFMWFLNIRFLGILMFGLFFFNFNNWVFVPRPYTCDSHALIWLILCFEKKIEFLGLETKRNWGFCSIGLRLVKLTCVIDWLCHYMMLFN